MILRHMRKKEQRKTIPLHHHLHHRNRKGPRIRHCLRTLGSLSPNLLSLRTNLAGWTFILSASFDSKAFFSGPNIRSNINHQGRVQGAAGGQEAKDHQGAEQARDSPENHGEIMLPINRHGIVLFYVTNIGLQSTDIVSSYIRTFTVMLLFPKNCRATANSFWPSSLWLKSKIGAGRKMSN